MKKSELKALIVGQRVSVTGTMDEQRFDGEAGTVVDNTADEVLVRFDAWSKGHGPGQQQWYFRSDMARRVSIKRLAATPKPEPTPRKRPHGKQEYKGNGKHEWETVTGTTVRLRVPGGWLYGRKLMGEVLANTTFVPVPQAVGYAV